MKQRCRFITLCLLSIPILVIGFIQARAQSVYHDWSKGIGGPGNDVAYSISADYPGYVYVVGSFTGTVDFDPGAGVVNLTSDGATDGFVLKLDTTGVLIWVKKIGGVLSQNLNSVAVDTIGGVYISGAFTGTTDLDPSPTLQNVTSNGGTDIVIFHLDSAGNYVWGKSFGGTGADDGTAVVIDSLGNTYVTGTFANTVDFDPGPAVVNLISNGNTATDIDVFLVKLDLNANLIWARGTGGLGKDTCRSLALDNQLNIFLTGGFSGTVDFDPGPAVVSLTSSSLYASNTNGFLVKFNSAGILDWARGFGWTAHTIGLALATDHVGDVFVTGQFIGTVDLAPLGGAAFVFNGFNDIFLSKFDGNGNFQWGRRIGGTAHDHAYCLKVDNLGDIYLSGSFALESSWTQAPFVDLDPGPNIYRATSITDGPRSFVAKLNGAGDFYWARWFSGGTTNTHSSILCYLALDGQSNLYMTGSFLGQINPVDFDPGPTFANLSNAGASDFYVMKWQQQICGLAVYSSASVNLCDSIVINGVSYTQTGNYSVLFASNGGCDSISNIGFSIHESSSSMLSVIACDSFDFNGIYCTTNGVYSDTFSNPYGCDSIVTLHLTLLQSTVDTLLQTVCDSFVLNGVAYYSTGFHTQYYYGVNGCDSIIVLDLTVPVVDVSVANNGTSLTSNAIGATYQWIDCNGLVPIPGEANQSFVYSQLGSYAVAVSQNGCTDTSVCFIVNSVEDFDDAGPLILYPNPTAGYLTVEGRTEWHNAEIRVMDVRGRVVLSEIKERGSKVSLNVRGLSAGMYVIEVRDRDRIQRAKFSKL